LIWALLFISTLLSAWALTALLRAYAMRGQLMDTPNPRSSHTVPTPRGGGLAIVVAFIVGSVALVLSGDLGLRFFTAIAIGGLVVGAIGFWDDHADLSRKLRLVVQIVASVWAVYWLGGVPGIALGSIELDGGFIGAVVAVLVLVWVTNLYNFMDGIDAIASLEAITVSLGAASVLWWNGAIAETLWLVLLASATLGFLFWNWPPAKIFMGDVGSGFLGFTLGVLAIATSHSGAINLWAWLILLGVFLADSTVTLLTRMMRKDRWYEAHRSHAYQHAARLLGSHLPVSATVAVINLLWLLPLAWASVAYSDWAWLLTILAYVPLVVGAIWLRAGHPECFGQQA
jgi:Fuc2NAc and GlcNAc transferase